MFILKVVRSVLFKNSVYKQCVYFKNSEEELPLPFPGASVLWLRLLEEFQPLLAPLILPARGVGSDGNESRACAVNWTGLHPSGSFGDG